MAGGRPTKYNPKICEEVLNLFKQGKSIAQVCLKMDINKSTFYEWKEKHEEFSNAIKEGLHFSQGWWEEQGQQGLWYSNIEGAEKLNYTGWFMNMKNRFKNDWKDKQPEEIQEEQKPQKVVLELKYKKDGSDS